MTALPPPKNPLFRGGLLAVLAAVAFGVTTPFLQKLGRGVGPVASAALLYAGAALASVDLRRHQEAKEAAVRRAHLPRLLVVAAVGALVAPVCLLLGLAHTSVTSASLLLNFEAVFTVLLAWRVYREPVGRRVALALVSMLVGGGCLVVGSADGAGGRFGWGVVAVLAATFAWALDNTLSRPLADLSPTAVVRWKGGMGAAVGLLISFVLHQRFPDFPAIAGLLACGATGYGVSLRLYLLAQRQIGTARTGSIFAIGPFAGVGVAWLLGERSGNGFTLVAGALFLGGVYLHLTETHVHRHAHEPLQHEHVHTHDDGHHLHTHAPPVVGEHSHVHQHGRMTHAHPHAPDLHHRHRHESASGDHPAHRHERALAPIVLVLLLLAAPSPARAAEALACTRIDRANVVPCVLHANPSLASASSEVEAVRSRQATASAWLPANPVVSLTGARRHAERVTDDATNWTASLAQEVEVGGQRGARREAAEAQLTAEESRLAVTRRQLAADALKDFFSEVASEEEVALATSLAGTVDGIAAVARARAQQGLASPLDATLADAGSARVLSARLAAERRRAAARSALASSMGFDPSAPMEFRGDLTPLAGVEDAARRATTLGDDGRPELRAAAADRRTFDSRASLYRRLRIPNPSLSVFAENDGFDERVFGVGISFPVPLPGSVGHSYTGEIAEAEARSQKAGSDALGLRRRLSLDLAVALDDYTSRRREVEALTADRLQRARDGLRLLTDEIRAGRISVREGLVAERDLLELLQLDLAARRDLAIASVDLAVAAGAPLEQGAP